MTEGVGRDVALGASGWITLALALGPLEPIRVVAVFAFVFFCPGFAVVRLTNLTGRLEINVIAIALSLAIATIISETLSVFHLFTADRSLVLLSTMTSLSVIAKWLRQKKSEPQPVSPENR